MSLSPFDFLDALRESMRHIRRFRMDEVVEYKYDLALTKKDGRLGAHETMIAMFISMALKMFRN